MSGIKTAEEVINKKFRGKPDLASDFAWKNQLKRERDELRAAYEALQKENAELSKRIIYLKASLQECMDEAAEWLNECRGIEPEGLSNHAWYSRAKALLEPTKDE